MLLKNYSPYKYLKSQGIDGYYSLFCYAGACFITLNSLVSNNQKPFVWMSINFENTYRVKSFSTN